MSNQKTFRSLDLTTICPKLAAGNPCSYCYVQTSRTVGFNAKKIEEVCEYSHDILRLSDSSIDTLNQCGGLRVFSFADYIPWMDDSLLSIVEDAKQKKLQLKAITKSIDFINKWWKSFNIINASIDNLGEGIPIETAKALKVEYPNVRIRAVITSYEDLKELNWVDVITLNHGLNGYYRFNKVEMQKISEKYPGKVCCTTGRCITCSIKCGK